MKTVFYILSILCFSSCQKDKIIKSVPQGMLVRVTESGKTQYSYEYSSGLLVKENMFMGCETPPVMISYTYQAGALKSLKTATRALYSSLSTALCDPATPVEERLSLYEYGANQKIAKVVHEKTTLEYHYNAAKQVEKMIAISDTRRAETSFKYDDAGNLVEKNGDGLVGQDPVTFEYDKRANPLNMMKKSHQSLSPFDSPNNVIRSRDRNGKVLWEREFTYNSEGLPDTCLETNGAMYTYHYNQ